MTVKKTLNLNTVVYDGKRRRKIYPPFHYRGDLKIAGEKTDVQECKECHKVLPLMAFTTSYRRGDGASILKKACRECCSSIATELNQVKKNLSPKPERCECCHKKIEKLQVDHLHGSTTFRGWLCNDCNSGLGELGDNLGGVLQGAIYLENDINKIKEKLQEIYNKMFARTQ